jgi:hypothetical protein
MIDFQSIDLTGATNDLGKLQMRSMKMIGHHPLHALHCTYSTILRSYILSHVIDMILLRKPDCHRWNRVLTVYHPLTWHLERISCP